MTKKMSENILEGSRLDHKLSVQLAGVIDLIAAEAKYHLVCFKAFTRMSSKLEQVSRGSDIGMAWLCGDFQKIADKGQMVQLDDVWERYETFAKEASVDIPQQEINFQREVA